MCLVLIIDKRKLSRYCFNIGGLNIALLYLWPSSGIGGTGNKPEVVAIHIIIEMVRILRDTMTCYRFLVMPICNVLNITS